MTDWRTALQRVRDEFVEDMARLGFTQQEEDPRILVGEISPHGPEQPPHFAVEIDLVDGFPYRPPKVRPFDGSGSRSWHQEADGTLCLYSEDDLEALLWTDPEELVARIVEWYQKDLAGWPDDPPDLDLERYFERDPTLVIYDLERVGDLVGRQVRLSKGRDALTISMPATPPKKSKNIAPGKYGWVVDVGELERPFRTWEELAELLGECASGIENDVRRGRGDVLLVRYTRDGHLSVAALRLVRGKKGMIQFVGLMAADRSPATRLLRAGLDTPFLRDKHVTVVGLGAVGSFLADLLARQGVGKLTLVDGDLLRPGNCARHLAPLSYEGTFKVAAVKELIERAYPELVEVVVEPSHLRTPDEAERLLVESDLLVDATARLPVTTMLSDMAQSVRARMLAVYIQRDGGVVRVDRWPLRQSDGRLAPVPPLPDDKRTLLREGGCGDPVSPTPPSSVLAAASLACRMAVDTLVGRLELPASAAQVLAVQEEHPYDELTLLS